MDVQRYDMRVDISNYGLNVELDPEESDSGEWVRYSDHAAEVARLREACSDALSGWRYIRATHGDLYGVGWSRVEEKLDAALTARKDGA